MPHMVILMSQLMSYYSKQYAEEQLRYLQIFLPREEGRFAALSLPLPLSPLPGARGRSNRRRERLEELSLRANNGPGWLSYTFVQVSRVKRTLFKLPETRDMSKVVADDSRSWTIRIRNRIDEGD